MPRTTADSLVRLQKERQSAAIAILTKALPTMQAAALKHNYITSVMNVVQHPVHVIRDDDKAEHIIGFGDRDRTLPLVVIREPQPDGSIRHAFVPSLRTHEDDKTRTIDSRLIDALQEYDVHWSQRHMTNPRNIRNLISRKGRHGTNLHGINSHDPGPQRVAYDPELDRPFEQRPWWPTDFIASNLDFPAEHSIDTAPGSRDMRRIERNVETSIQRVGHRIGPRSISLHLKTTPKQPVLRIDNLDYSGQDPDRGPEY